MNNRTTLLFADRETIALMRYKSKLVNNMDLSNAVVLTGWGTKNLSDIDYRENDNSIRFYNSEDIFNIGTLIISEPYRYCILESNILPFLENNKKTIEKIFCYWDSQSKTIETFCKKYKIEFYNNENEKVIIENKNKNLYQLRVPIVYISSISEMSDKFLCQMEMFNYFKEKGYNVQLVGTKSYSKLLGIKSFPSFMIENYLSNTEKIIAFNHYLKYIEDIDNPDLIIIGIPGGINGFINEVPGYFDDLQYLVSRATKPDITIICGLYNEVQEAEKLSSIIENKYGWRLDGVFINNMLFDLQLSKIYDKKEYVKINNEVVQQKIIEANQNKITSFYSYENLNKLYESIEDKLISYGNENLI